MIELNLLTVLYLFLRLAPFIIVCFFVLNSLFNQDFRGVIYIHGLIACCVLSSMIYKIVGPMIGGDEKKNPSCTLTSFSKEPSSHVLPIGQNILGFTFFYLLYTILAKNLHATNIVTLAFYPLLIVFDFAWNVSNSCYSIGQLLASLILGGSLGTFCSYIITQFGYSSFQYFYLGEPTSEVCNRPAKQTFKCNVYKNGTLIGSTNA
jgi:hypothetical protein